MKVNVWKSITGHINQLNKRMHTSLRTALNRPLLVFLAAAGFGTLLAFRLPNLISVRLLMVSALILGASPSITNTSFTPIRVSEDTRKNRFLYNTHDTSLTSCERLWNQTVQMWFQTHLRWGFVTFPIMPCTCWASQTHRLRSTARVFPARL